MTPPPTSPTAEHGVLDDAALRRWLFRARDELGRHRGRLDALNVYPVPDGDTGTNLFLTLDGGVRGFLEALMTHAREDGGPLGVVGGVAALARASLFAARGNSGVILSQLIAGLADALSGRKDGERGLDGPGLADALTEADARARAAVADPVEGTILTVIRAAATSARAGVAAGRDSLAAVVEAACAGARVALEATPTQLETLARAGVVDAGGAGLVVVLDALASVVRGETGDVSDDEPAWLPPPGSSSAPGPIELREPVFEVMYLLDGAGQSAVRHLVHTLEGLGDSVVVAGDPSLRTVHVHTPDAGAAVEAGLEVGRPYGIRISLLPSGGEPKGCGDPDAVRPEESTQRKEGTVERAASLLGVVACVQAPGVVPLFEDSGAAVVADGPGLRVTPAALVNAAHESGGRRVVVLPNDGDALMAADAARTVAAEEGIDLEVIPTRHLLQGVAALAVYDPTDPATVAHMADAAEAVRYGLVATATRPATTDAGECRAGDVIGFVGDHIAHVGGDACEVAVAVIDTLAGDSAELVTLVEGEGADGLAVRIREAVADRDWEVDVLDGGQAVYDLLIGVE